MKQQTLNELKTDVYGKRARVIHSERCAFAFGGDCNCGVWPITEDCEEVWDAHVYAKPNNYNVVQDDGLPF